MKIIEQIIPIIIIATLITLQSCESHKRTPTKTYITLLNEFKSSTSSEIPSEYLKNASLLLQNERLPNSSDIKLLLRLAKKKLDFELMRMIEQKLLIGGIELKEVEEIISPIHIQSNKNDLLELAKPCYHRIDTSMRKLLMIAKSKDSLYNSIYHEWRKGEINLTKDELINNALEVHNSFNLIINTIGFPSENKIGYYSMDGQIVTYHETLLIHTYQRGELPFVHKLDSLHRNGYIDINLYNNLKSIRGFGNSTGVKDELTIRYNKYKKNDL